METVTYRAIAAVALASNFLIFLQLMTRETMTFPLFASLAFCSVSMPLNSVMAVTPREPNPKLYVYTWVFGITMAAMAVAAALSHFAFSYLVTFAISVAVAVKVLHVLLERDLDAPDNTRGKLRGYRWKEKR